MREMLTVQVAGRDQPVSVSQFHTHPVRIGRDESSELRLDARGVSRCHAVIERENGSWFVEDVQSTNGTYVNGRLTEYAALKAGDLIKIGPYQLMIGLEYELGTDVESEIVQAYARRRSGDPRIVDELQTMKLWQELKSHAHEGG